MPVVVSLFDESGNMLRPWADAGYECHAYDWSNTNRVELCGAGSITYHKVDLRDQRVWDTICDLRPMIVFGFPPCTDLAASGAKHWAAKREADPLTARKAMELVMVTKIIADRVRCPWMIENPIGRIPTYWRDYDFTFQPNEYGGWLPVDDQHPRWPAYIPARDAYTKRTCIWHGNGFKVPSKLPVAVDRAAPQHAKLGGTSAKTKQIRSETPRGFAMAVHEANKKPRI